METLVANLTGKARRETLNGRPFVVAPAALIVPGVLPGSEGPLLYELAELQRNPRAWNGMPVTLGHPNVNGQFVSARSPGVLNDIFLGFVFNASAADKLAAEVWLDEELTTQRAPQVLNAVWQGQAVELSTGLFMQQHEAAGESNGRPYVGIARGHEPDHLAILVGQAGACSISDGCGLNVNAAPGQPRHPDTQTYQPHADATARHPALTDLDKALGADARRQKIQTGHNPPNWAVDEALWEKAKEKARKGGYEEGTDTFWAVVSHIYQQMGGEIKGTGTKNAEEPTMNRERALAVLTANCKCDKDKAALNGLSDETLLALAGNADPAKCPECGAMLGADDIKAGKCPKCGKALPDKMTGNAASANSTTAAGRAVVADAGLTTNAQTEPPMKTAEQWAAEMFPGLTLNQLQGAMQTALAVERKEKEMIVNRLVAHRPEAQRPARAAELMKLALGELQERLADLPAPAANSGQPDPAERFPLYFGANGAAPAANVRDDSDNVLPEPVFEFAAAGAK